MDMYNDCKGCKQTASDCAKDKLEPAIVMDECVEAVVVQNEVMIQWLRRM